jgi:hypothetical protein
VFAVIRAEPLLLVRGFAIRLQSPRRDPAALRTIPDRHFGNAFLGLSGGILGL